MNIPQKEAQALGRLLVKNFSSAGERAGMSHQSKQAHEPAPELLRGEASKEPAQKQAQPELPPRPSLFSKPPGFLAGLIVGFALRFITEFIKLLLSGG